MKLPILRLDAEQPDSWYQSEIDPALLLSNGYNGTISLYLIKNTDLPQYKMSQELVADLGLKDPRLGLKRKLLGKEKIPLVEGTYKNVAQLKRSVRDFLRVAQRVGDKNIYIVAIPGDLFDQIQKSCGQEVDGLQNNQSYHSEAGSDAWRQILALLPDEPIPSTLSRSLLGNSFEMQAVQRMIMRTTHNDLPVLILGETGTGKELVARAIHNLNRSRSGHEFIVVNCAAIPSELLESELFGHKRGSFTNAITDKTGLWKMAHGGTLFLDEVGDLTPQHQVKILRALEEKKVRPIGESKEFQVDVRIVAATNRDLMVMVRSGQFREDLYYRLRGLLIPTQPLRFCKMDIGLLAEHFWKKISGQQQALPQELLAKMQNYDWPGNVRELKTVLSTLHMLFNTDKLSTKHWDSVMAMMGKYESPTKNPKKQLEVHRLECFHHLSQADDILRACKIALRPLIHPENGQQKGVRNVKIELSGKIVQLELLCMRPRLFHSAETFDSVCTFSGQMRELQKKLQSNAKKALTYWQATVHETYEVAQVNLFQTIADLTMY